MFKESEMAGIGLGSVTSRGKSFLHDWRVKERLHKSNSMVGDAIEGGDKVLAPMCAKQIQRFDIVSLPELL